MCCLVEDQVLTGGCVVGSIFPVQRCALMRSAGNVYSLMVGEQLLPKKLLGTFLCASSSKLVVLFLVIRHSWSPRVKVKNEADWRRRMRCMWCGGHDSFLNSRCMVYLIRGYAGMRNSSLD